MTTYKVFGKRKLFFSPEFKGGALDLLVSRKIAGIKFPCVARGLGSYGKSGKEDVLLPNDEVLNASHLDCQKIN